MVMYKIDRRGGSKNRILKRTTYLKMGIVTLNVLTCNRPNVDNIAVIYIVVNKNIDWCMMEECSHKKIISEPRLMSYSGLAVAPSLMEDIPLRCPKYICDVNSGS